MAAAAAGNAERRLLDASLRCVNDQPRKKKRRTEEEEKGRSLVYLQLRRDPDQVRPNTFLVRLFRTWTCDPLSRRVVASQFGYRSINALSDDAPLPAVRQAGLTHLEKRHPSLKEEDFINFETMKDFVTAKNGTEMDGKSGSFKAGDQIVLAHKTAKGTYELHRKENATNLQMKDDNFRNSPLKTRFNDECYAKSKSPNESFDILSDFSEEIFPGIEPGINSGINPFVLKIPFDVETQLEMTRKTEKEANNRILICGCEDDSLCFSFDFKKEAASKSSLEWRSESTSQVEISFDGGSGLSHLLNPGALPDLDSLEDSCFEEETSQSGAESEGGNRRKDSRDMNSFSHCGIPLLMLKGKSLGERRKEILKLAFVEDLVKGKVNVDDANMKVQNRKRHPFICEGEIVNLHLNSSEIRNDLKGFKETVQEDSGKFESLVPWLDYAPSPVSVLVMPRFDFTLAEYLQQTNEASNDMRLSFLLQSLEAVSHLHALNFVHGRLSPSSFIVDVQTEGQPRLLLSSFEEAKFGDGRWKEEDATKNVDLRKLDSWHLGRLALRLFDADVEDDANFDASFSVNDLPVLESDAPLEMDILLHHLLRKNPSERISPSVAANMLHLYTWRTDFLTKWDANRPRSPAHVARSDVTEAQKSGGKPPHALAKEYEAALRILESRGATNDVTGDVIDDAVQKDLKRSLFARANLADLVHADEMWKESRKELERYAATRDRKELKLFFE